MIALEFGIDQRFELCARHRVVVVLVPDAVAGACQPVLPDAIGTSAQPAHTGAGRLGIGECQAQVIDFVVHECIVESLTSRCAVEQQRIHVQQSFVGQSPNDRVYTAAVSGAVDGSFRRFAEGAACGFVAHLHADGYGAVVERNLRSVVFADAEQLAGRRIERNAQRIVSQLDFVAVARRAGCSGRRFRFVFTGEVGLGEPNRIAPRADAAARVVIGFEFQQVAVEEVLRHLEAGRAGFAGRCIRKCHCSVGHHDRCRIGLHG